MSYNAKLIAVGLYKHGLEDIFRCPKQKSELFPVVTEFFHIITTVGSEELAEIFDVDVNYLSRCFISNRVADEVLSEKGFEMQKLLEQTGEPEHLLELERLIAAGFNFYFTLG